MAKVSFGRDKMQRRVFKTGFLLCLLGTFLVATSAGPAAAISPSCQKWKSQHPSVYRRWYQRILSAHDVATFTHKKFAAELNKVGKICERGRGQSQIGRGHEKWRACMCGVGDALTDLVSKHTDYLMSKNRRPKSGRSTSSRNSRNSRRSSNSRRPGSKSKYLGKAKCDAYFKRQARGRANFSPSRGGGYDTKCRRHGHKPSLAARRGIQKTPALSNRRVTAITNNLEKWATNGQGLNNYSGSIGSGGSGGSGGSDGSDGSSNYISRHDFQPAKPEKKVEDLTRCVSFKRGDTIADWLMNSCNEKIEITFCIGPCTEYKGAISATANGRAPINGHGGPPALTGKHVT